MKNFLYLLLFLTAPALAQQPTLSFTFDDGSTRDKPGYTLQQWNEKLLNTLDSAKLKAYFFVKTEGMDSERGQYLLNSWNARGHKIANHTLLHPYFNSEKNPATRFETELLTADSLISQYSNHVKMFRFPYLKEGQTPEKVDSIRQIMARYGYRNGHVTIDASDWYIDSRLMKRLKDNPQADLTAFRDFYLEHLYERAQFYEKLSYRLTGRHIKHTLLLHHNLTAALFLDDLIAHFKAKGWNIVSAEEAFADPIYQNTPRHAGESLIWSMAKDSGQYEDQLRYPAEDSRYEKARMDQLGL